MNEKVEKKYYKYIDIIRVLSCLAVILYHLNILKGGYLAVCVFFCLSGYLSVVSALNKKDFSLKEYYLSRTKKLYIPLITVVFMSIAATTIFNEINWINLKPETTSVLLGYNNFWQLNANLDYFTRHIDSPFMHLWYIAILLQFDLVFPFIYKLLNKIAQKSKKLAISIPLVFAIFSAIYFYISIHNGNIMFAYYNTFTRAFSLLFGMSLGMINTINKKNKKISDKLNKALFTICLLILIILFIFVDASSLYFAISMILTTLLSLGLIYNSSKIINNKNNKVLSYLSNITYEIYLIQYPVIFIFQYININIYLKLLFIVLIILILSYCIHLCFNKTKQKENIKKIICVLVLLLTIIGIFTYITSEDTKKEMHELELQLNENEKLMQEHQEEYQNNLQQEEDNFKEALSTIAIGESNLQNEVTKLKITGVGDSVMLGAVETLYKTFTNSYFDAKVSRSIWAASDILKDLKDKKMLGDVVIINLGANGDCSEKCRDNIMSLLSDKKVFWLTVTNDDDVHFNDKIKKYAEKYDNLYIIDWNTISNGHTEYFYKDGLHLTVKGRTAYANAIYDSILDVYTSLYQEQKDTLLKEYEEKINNKWSFYGNDLLLNAYEFIHEDYPDTTYIINKDFTFSSLKDDIESKIQDNKLTNKILFAFDTTLNLTLEEYIELITLLKNYKVDIISFTKGLADDLQEYENVTVIDFYEELQSHPEYLMSDNIHLTNAGNSALQNIISSIDK